MAVSQMAATNPDFGFYEDMVKNNTGHIDSLLKELLSYAVYKTPRFSIVDPLDIIEISLKEITDKVKMSGIELKKELVGEGKIKADKLQLSIAITNILLNSIEAIQEKNFKEEKGEIILKTSVDSTYFNLFISDNGTGMTEDTQKLIMEPFFTSKENGSGMGMANTKNIIDTHRGQINLKSTVDEGSSFIITLPLVWKNE